MSTWRKEVALDDETRVESEVVVPDGRDSFTVDRATVERLLTEAGYAPAAAG